MKLKDGIRRPYQEWTDMLEGLNLESAVALLGLKEVMFQNKTVLLFFIFLSRRHVNATHPFPWVRFKKYALFISES